MKDVDHHWEMDRRRLVNNQLTDLIWIHTNARIEDDGVQPFLGFCRQRTCKSQMKGAKE